ncbi:hypothetical protein C7M61_001826 [Candidozyma pseudohaemuli]|uniref:Elongator complex protein 1 n=1 Tax=Candidozyma pseudohaemuli TaxID=418784 RepID=A0A2P7YTD0_9ASCO|nr:hypothetical protein C7M61_001826 [[Candida] pseudohaemulonii]PSK39223.1 hypothetical protein C7M61_001826 [[Candida] pseudohaemulonii]
MGKDRGSKVLCFFENPCNGSKLICFKQFAESDTLIFIFENGDVVAALLHEEAGDDFSLEIVGLLDTKLKAAEWSPDEEILVLITYTSKMILLSRSFEPILELQLDAMDADEVAVSNVSVGWGKKETQFQGRGFKALEREREALKYAGLDLQETSELRDPTVRAEEKGDHSRWDDGEVYIAWRDDCNVFAVSLKRDENSEKGRRLIRFFSRDGNLEAVSEAVDGLQVPLCWKSQGNLLTALRDLLVDGTSKHSQIIFFERNGLRHGEFLILNEKIIDISWSCDGGILAILYHDRAQFWTTKNYHWYLKQEIKADEEELFTSVRFHPEKAFTVILTLMLHLIKVLTFASVICDGPSVKGLDEGIVNVIDGSKIKLTALAIANIPPPMAIDPTDGAVRFEHELPSKAVKMKPTVDSRAALVELYDGSLLAFDAQGELDGIKNFSQLCLQMEGINFESQDGSALVAFGLSESGKLFCGNRLLANGVTSIKLTDQFLCITTAQSKLVFVHLENLLTADLSYITQGDLDDERTRDIERGSMLVTAIPSKYSVVLQALRGNLETVFPRIMVLQAVRTFIKNKCYLEAFKACRTHRIDLDILHDLDPTAFEKNVAHFINEIKKVEYLDLFVSCLHEGDVTESKYSDTLKLEEKRNDVNTNHPNQGQLDGKKVNKICDIILQEVSRDVYSDSYLQVQITALACQRPPQDKAALELVSGIADTTAQDNALTHLCYLREALKLYDEALGIYDVDLALKVAQKSQMDPKEYLPFLQTLYDASLARRNFLIDDHLKLHEKALSWLFQLADETFEEFETYMISHNLYRTALRLTKHIELARNLILKHFANHLANTRDFAEAARLFEFLDESQMALDNFIKAKLWKEALSIAKKIKNIEDYQAVAQTLAIELEDDRNYADAATIHLDFLDNKAHAVKLYCKAFDFDTALLTARISSSESMENTFIEEVKESFGIMSELLADCNGQLNSQLKRLREIRKKREVDPVNFYGSNGFVMDAPDDVSVAPSDASTTQSFFTRYTGKTGETARTGESRRTLKNKKREERKRAKGRKGTVYEEEYLIRSVGRLIERLDSSINDAEKLVNTLLRRSMWEEAHQIWRLWNTVTEFLEQNINEIHDVASSDRERIDENGQIYLAPEIPIPVIRHFPRFQALDF